MGRGGGGGERGGGGAFQAEGSLCSEQKVMKQLDRFQKSGVV